MKNEKRSEIKSQILIKIIEFRELFIHEAEDYKRAYIEENGLEDVDWKGRMYEFYSENFTKIEEIELRE